MKPKKLSFSAGVLTGPHGVSAKLSGITIEFSNRKHPIERMRKLGSITDRQYAAFRQIELAAMGVASAPPTPFRRQETNARFGNGDTGRDGVIEMIAISELQLIMRKWARTCMPPKRMHIDFILGNKGLVEISEKYELNYRTARARFLQALDKWADLVEQKIG